MDKLKWQYVKITNNDDAKLMEDNIHNYLTNDLTVVVYNFVDMLSHARTEMEVLKELAGDENILPFAGGELVRAFAAIQGIKEDSRKKHTGIYDNRPRQH